MLHARELLEHGVLLDAHAADRRDAAEVVARQVDQHLVLGALLGVGQELGGQALVLLVVAPAPARAGDRDDLAQRAAQGRQALGRRADQRHPGALEVEHVRRGVHEPQHAVEREWVALEALLEALAEHGLEDLALGDLVPQALDPGLEARALDARARLGLEQAKALGRGQRPVEVGHQALEARARPRVVLGAQRTGAEDEQPLARVVEGDDVEVEVEDDVGHAVGVVRGARHARLERAGPLVAEEADPAAAEGRQAGRGRGRGEAPRGLAQGEVARGGDVLGGMPRRSSRPPRACPRKLATGSTATNDQRARRAGPSTDSSRQALCPAARSARKARTGVVWSAGSAAQARRVRSASRAVEHSSGWLTVPLSHLVGSRGSTKENGPPRSSPEAP